MKKNARPTHELEEGVALGLAAAAGLAAAREWATPRVDAAYEWAKPRWEKGIETAGPALQDSVRKASEGISGGIAGGIAVVAPKIQDGIDKVGPRISQVIDDTTPKIQGTLDKAAPALNSAKVKVVDDYLPTLSTKLGDAADTASRSLASAHVPPAVEKAVIRITGDKKAVKKAQKRLVAATLQASKDLKKSQRRNKGKGWLIVGIVLSAIVAGVAVWRASKPVEDPWKTPAPIKAAPAPVSSEKTREANEVVTSIKEAAGRAAASEGDVTSNAKSDDKAKAANDAKNDAKVRATDAAKSVADKAKDATEAAKHAAKPSDDSKA
ncbi:hypothetical protein [Arthrobacter antioxidans]|uniref:hypothetical protein n=1 Tax=Arthrobacter antioxidans TaxID=2895818 RepID=UPI001FFF92E1|nr:hypothetical protein [Arthrobacter antioxidans]